jgi:predicted transcriptional regulator
MTENQRLIIMLTLIQHSQGSSNISEISRRVGVSRTAVRNTIKNQIKQLRKLNEQH